MNSLYVLAVLACAVALTAAQENARSASNPCAGETCQLAVGLVCANGLGVVQDNGGCCPECVLEVALGKSCDGRVLNVLTLGLLNTDILRIQCADGGTCQNRNGELLCL